MPFKDKFVNKITDFYLDIKIHGVKDEEELDEKLKKLRVDLRKTMSYYINHKSDTIRTSPTDMKEIVNGVIQNVKKEGDGVLERKLIRIIKESLNFALKTYKFSK